ncbi:metallophosphoesterase [Neobacillus sp. NPDC097160]|uniref:metallophosphoesterase n=1 Tax=Neobacillus sp. NPDC097160 TaxID=3364298 RepID=UPI003810F811
MQASTSETPVLQFPVLSDIHIGGASQQERFKRALYDMQAIAPNYDALVLLGDNTNMGTEKEYDDLDHLLQAYSKKDAEKIITIGNHDYWEGVYSTGDFNPKKYIQRFVDKTGMPGLYYDKWVNGYHFITLGSEGFPDHGGADHVLMSDEQYNWFDEVVAQDADHEKPIFVFLHQPIDNTVYGSEEWGAGFSDTRLSDILKKYPQVILFSGHTHYLLQHPRSIYQDGFTMVNAGSVAYGYTDIAYPGTSQGLLVNVYSDRIEIKAREFTTNSDIQTFTVKTPYEKTYGDSQKPLFLSGTKVNLDNNTSGDRITLSFDAAIDNTLVDRYLVKHNGKVIHTEYVKFWNKSLPQRMTFDIKNLITETRYDFVISAVDAWNNESISMLKTSFTTPKLNGWKLNGEEWVYYEDGSIAKGWRLIDGKRYFFLDDGTMCTGWYSSGSQRYYLNDNGAMQIGWKLIDEKWYFFQTDGTMRIGWYSSGSQKYYLNNDGTMQVGWKLIDGKWFIFQTDGPMITGWYTSGSHKYYLNDNGAMQVGWKLVDGKWYFFQIDGSMSIGWYSSGSQKYYLNDNGVMQVGWKDIDGQRYYFGPDGALKKGWVEDNHKWYYLDNNGNSKLGWIQDQAKWYYLKSDGMVTGWQNIDNKTWYFFNGSGSMQTGWVFSGGKWYFLSGSGAMKTGWILDSEKWYFLTSDGSMAINTSIQGYRVGSDGAWIK